MPWEPPLPDQIEDFIAAATYRPKPWHLRFWHGMRFGTWIRLLARNGFRVAPGAIPLALGITLISIVNTVARWVQEVVLWPVISLAKVNQPPVFIIGHWRSGTTLLHELLLHDPRFRAPSTLHCMNPNHFLLTGWIIRLLGFLLPEKRPMDDMQTGWDLPQEDEFALVNLGQPSPYLDMAFPLEGRQAPESLTLRDMDPAARSRWKNTLSGFLRRVSLGHGSKILLLKSPTHTARIRTLLEMYPGARFILITREPEAVFASTVKLWHALNMSQGLQHPDPARLKDKVLVDFETLFEALNEDVDLIPAGQFAHLHYEDLLDRPATALERVYSELDLNGFDQLEPAIRRYFAERADYVAGSYHLDAELAAEIARRWRPLMAAWGYDEAPERVLIKS